MNQFNQTVFNTLITMLLCVIMFVVIQQGDYISDSYAFTGDVAEILVNDNLALDNKITEMQMQHKLEMEQLRRELTEVCNESVQSKTR